MAQIVIRVLHPHSIKTFIYNLTPEETETIAGGGYPYGFHINNITDEVNIHTIGGNTWEPGGSNSLNYRDNKINTIDYSRSIYNTFIY